jgi:hypothetical protein
VTVDVERLADAIAEADLTDLDRVELIDRTAARLGVRGLAHLGVVLWRGIEQASKVSPELAHDLVRGQHAMLSAFRPESPHNLDAGFAPTEPPPTSAPGSKP